MKLKIYQIDAFSKKIFKGNPAAVCPLDSWIDDSLMQKIAAENNLSETVFFVKEDDYYHIRWFTTSSEENLCGHATLASAYVLFEILDYKEKVIVFHSKSGVLKVSKTNDLYTLDFPLNDVSPIPLDEKFTNAFNIKPIEIHKSIDYLIVFEKEEDIHNLIPNFELIKQFDLRGVIVTAKSSKYDFICRFFDPNCGVPEDPVTGSAFTQLVPYWSNVLKKNEFNAKQVSQRGGEVFAKLNRERVFISGNAVKYLEGEIYV